MQRATAHQGKWVGALGTGLALPFFSFMAQAAGVRDVPAPRPDVAAMASQAVPARWRDYALASITPQFSWALAPQRLEPPRVLDSYTGRIEKAAPFGLGANGSEVSVSIANGKVSDTPVMVPGQPSRLVEAPQAGFKRTMVAPSLAMRWGESGSVHLTGLLAYQRFATLNLGMAQGDGWAPPPSWLGDSSYGAGVRVDIDNRLTERLGWSVGYQSHVSMGAFDRYRGVFADRADFDIPASFAATLEYAITPNFSADIGIQRIDYSSIRPFASSNLPRQFLALLGDGASPVFAWKDLDVYSIGWTLRDERAGNFQLRYTTRQQPIPSSRLLADALDPATANDMLSFGWSRMFGKDSRLSIMASYASSPYLLMMPTQVARRDATATRGEFEALWSMRF